MIPDDCEHDMSLTGRLLRDLRRRDDGKEIRDAADWERHRAEILQRVVGVLGVFPPRDEPLDIQWGQSVEMPSHTRREVSFAGEEGERITALVLIPRNLSGPVPGILCPHPTSVDGKQTTAIPGREPKDGYQYGWELADRGFVTIASDHFTVPPRVPVGREFDSRPFETAHPNWSAFGKAAWDQMRCLDLLQTLPEVDGSRLGSIGFSLGGHTTLLTAAFDPRVKAAVMACGTSTLRGDRNRRYVWVREAENYHYMPKLGPWLDRDELPFDFHELAACVAPRALMVQSGYHDVWCPGSAVMGEFAARVHDIYGLCARSEAFAHLHHGEHHNFGPLWRGLAYEWLRRWLTS